MEAQENNGQTISAGESKMDLSGRSAEAVVSCVTLDEIALYDRQIRLWGVKAQEKYGILLALRKGMDCLTWSYCLFTD